MKKDIQDMNKRQLVNKIAEQTGFNQEDVYLFLSAFSDVIVETIKSDQSVYIRGLGAFKPQFQASRLVRNPKTCVEMMSTPRTSIRFKVGEDVLRKLNDI